MLMTPSIPGPEIVKSLTGKAMREFDVEIQKVLEKEADARMGGAGSSNGGGSA